MLQNLPSGNTAERGRWRGRPKKGKICPQRGLTLKPTLNSKIGTAQRNLASDESVTFAWMAIWGSAIACNSNSGIGELSTDMQENMWARFRDSLAGVCFIHAT